MVANDNVVADNKYTCSKCGNLLTANVNNFYKSYSNRHKSGFATDMCKKCVYSYFEELINKGSSIQESTIEICKILDKPFILDIFQNCFNKHANNPRKLIGMYFKEVHMPQTRKLGIITYNDSDFNGEKKESKNKNAKQIKEQTNETVISNLDNVVEITDDDKKQQEDVIRMLGYDPFAGYSKFDKKFLYNEILPYLDEDTLEDQYKISMIIQLLNNNNQVRKIDLLINQLSSNVTTLLQNSGEIKTLTNIKNQIVTNNDKISKENSIAVKHRGDSKAGKSTLGHMMKNLRELEFDKAEEDYYDMSTAKGMSQVADISNKSILSQLNFDEKDTDDMLKTQRELIQRLQKEKLECDEKLRQANLKIIELEKLNRNEGVEG